MLGPALRDLQRSFKDLERSSRGSLIHFKVSTSRLELPIKYYSEKDLETLVYCDNCGLQFSVYGLFAVCPDCNRPNSMSMFMKSIEVVHKRIEPINNIPSDEKDLREGLLADCVSSCVSTFDSLGKRLRLEYPDLSLIDQIIFFRTFLRWKRPCIIL